MISHVWKKLGRIALLVAQLGSEQLEENPRRSHGWKHVPHAFTQKIFLECHCVGTFQMLGYNHKQKCLTQRGGVLEWGRK